MILVLGATGIAGSQVVRALLRQNEEVRVFVRDAEKARSLFGNAVEIASRRCCGTRKPNRPGLPMCRRRMLRPSASISCARRLSGPRMS